MDTDFIDSIITNLKIISLVQINEKLGVHNGHLCIDHSSNIQFLKRWFNRDSRTIVLKFIKDLIKNIVKITDTDVILRITSELINVEKGIDNMKLTYSDDLVTIVTLELINMKFKSMI